MSGWTTKDIPNQQGRRVLITGANSGIGYCAALALARKGAQVLFASRDKARGEAAIEKLHYEVPGAKIELVVLDLASLAAVRQFAEQELARGLKLDLLINNAGVFAPPQRQVTQDGFEVQFGVNVLAHFLLTGLLLPALEKAEAPRVVTIASIAHKRGRLDFDDLQSQKGYNPMKAYQQSKLADLMLALEMDRRLKAHGSKVMSVAAHPGVANTNLFRKDHTGFSATMRDVLGGLIDLFLNSEMAGTLPTLYAATFDQVVGGGYYGPQGFQEMRGNDVGDAEIAAHARDLESAQRLWERCEEMSGISYL